MQRQKLPPVEVKACSSETFTKFRQMDLAKRKPPSINEMEENDQNFDIPVQNFKEDKKRSLEAARRKLEDEVKWAGEKGDLIDKRQKYRPTSMPMEAPPKRQRKSPAKQQPTRQERKYPTESFSENYTPPLQRAIGYDYENNDPFSPDFFDLEHTYTLGALKVRRSKWGSRHYIHLKKEKLGSNGYNMGGIRMSFPIEYIDSLIEVLRELQEEIAAYGSLSHDAF